MMTEEKQKKFLTVAPFQCAWSKDLKFKEAGRGCVAFDAFAHNDVTLVFRENVGSQHYHYKRDNSPHYTVILGSHRNRRLKIEVNGKTVVDAEGIGLCCSSSFQSYWICIYDGLISIGSGRYPFQNLVFQWLDSNPNCSVRYVGLSSWDKHVGYRNVNVLPLPQNHVLLWKQVDFVEHGGREEGEEEGEDGEEEYEKWGLDNYLENWELSNVIFVVGEEERLVPAHKVILQASGNFPFSLSNEDIVHLQDVTYPILYALLQFIYTGRSQVSESQLVSLRALSLRFEVMLLAKQCEETLERFKLNKKLFDSGKNVELLCPNSRPHCSATFPVGLPINVQNLRKFQSSGDYSDISIYIDGYGLAARPHKVILSLWSFPFAKMFTNGMSESSSSEVYLSDVSPEAFNIMLNFMYGGEIGLEDTEDFGNLLLQLLFLADKFGVTLLFQECCKILLECLSENLKNGEVTCRLGLLKSKEESPFLMLNHKILIPFYVHIICRLGVLLVEEGQSINAQDSVCPILLAVSSIPSCELIEETCLRKFATHFDYCTTASLDFISLDETTFISIIRHQDLTVTSEERVLNTILMWCMRATELYGWEKVDEQVASSSPDVIFQDRLQSLNNLLSFVRFPLLPCHLLEKMGQSNLCKDIRVCDFLVKEAIDYVKFGSARAETDQNMRFQHRRSSFKELQYICDGDSNGVLYFAGTSYGQHQWVNPVLAKRITITASSPTSRHTDPKALVSRTYQGTYFAGPRMENGCKCSWWMVDIGPDHQLMCNYYTLRQDGSRAFLRFWNLQGSLDGTNWTNLRAHEDDQTMCKPGQFQSWPIIGSNSLLPFRFFRVLLTGPTHTTGAADPWNLCICFLELYGFFR